jgi:2-polyprenyl-3-methyl-5-hydroxy-6-metoxy-1,4-benzoquinol methylase
MHTIKFNKSLTLEEDFREEVCEFFGVTEAELSELELQHGPFSSRKFRHHVYSEFAGKTGDDVKLFKAYGDAAFLYTLILGIGCPRYAHLFPFMEHVLGSCENLGRRLVAVDYGCGVGDTALLLSACGFEVHLVDLPDKKSEFARWRLERRGYSPQFISVTPNTPYPALPRPVELVVTIEVWEHLREPIRALRNINAATVPGQSFLFNTNEDFDYDVEGDHLQEAIANGRAREYRELYETAWKALPVGPGTRGHGRLLKRK